MRILFTIPHYHRPSQRGFHGSEQGAAERVASLTRCLSALHQHFGEKTQGLLDGPQQRVLPANQRFGNALEVVLCTTGEHHLLAHLPDGLCRRHATNAPPAPWAMPATKSYARGSANSTSSATWRMTGC